MIGAAGRVARGTNVLTRLGRFRTRPNPVGQTRPPLVEQAELSFAQQLLRSNSVSGSSLGVMMYFASALQTIKKLGAKRQKAIALELELL